MQATMVPGSKHSTTLMPSSHTSAFLDSGEYHYWHGEDNDNDDYDNVDGGGGGGDKDTLL